jgi:hypothetical protein
MLSKKNISKSICLIMWTLLVATGWAEAEILLPPTKIPFAADVVIERYVQGQLLELFSYTGRWDIVSIGDKLSLAGMSEKTPIYLFSRDKLSRNPKSFKFDFMLSDLKKECGFIYGDIGVIVRNNKIYPASFDIRTNMLKLNSKVGITIARGIQKNNTVDITTGYDQTGGKSQVCVIYINNTGLTFKYDNKDQPFGVYIGKKNSITINNFRWSIGSI